MSKDTTDIYPNKANLGRERPLFLIRYVSRAHREEYVFRLHCRGVGGVMERKLLLEARNLLRVCASIAERREILLHSIGETSFAEDAQKHTNACLALVVRINGVIEKHCDNHCMCERCLSNLDYDRGLREPEARP